MFADVSCTENCDTTRNHKALCVPILRKRVLLCDALRLSRVCFSELMAKAPQVRSSLTSLLLSPSCSLDLVPLLLNSTLSGIRHLMLSSWPLSTCFHSVRVTLCTTVLACMWQQLLSLPRSPSLSPSISLCLALEFECWNCIVLAVYDCEPISVTTVAGIKHSPLWNAACGVVK